AAGTAPARRGKYLPPRMSSVDYLTQEARPMTTRELQERPKGNGTPAWTLVGEVTLVPVALIDHDPEQPRKTMDRDTIAELAANIREHGLQQPIHVRPGPAGRFTEMIGARRLEAVKLLGWEEIPAFVHSGPLDAEKLRLVQVSE